MFLGKCLAQLKMKRFVKNRVLLLFRAFSWSERRSGLKHVLSSGSATPSTVFCLFSNSVTILLSACRHSWISCTCNTNVAICLSYISDNDKTTNCRKRKKNCGKQLNMLYESLSSPSHTSTADPVNIAFQRNFHSLMKVNVSVWGTVCPWISKQLDISRGQKTHHSLCNGWDRHPELGATARTNEATSNASIL